MKMKKRYLQKRPTQEFTVYSNEATTEAMEEELRFMREEDGQEDATEDQAWNRVYASIGDDWDDLITEARHANDDVNGWLVIANLGLWDGRHNGGKVFNTLDKAICAVCEKMDTVIIKEDTRGNVKVDGYHHDGTNHYYIHQLTNAGHAYWQGAGKWEDRETLCEKLAGSKRYHKNGRIRKMLGWC